MAKTLVQWKSEVEPDTASEVGISAFLYRLETSWAPHLLRKT